ncbi:hypothetical protein [Ostreiculturibacter nitratireducens]|uniref:anti-sigma factor family protein n=1 Tax=Ostreiculturibacter nitratireducens TaxID=3075226 RepID=UPI0031B56B04
MTLSDSDLERANAFHDGELEPEEAERFRARLAKDPELRQALEEIREVSSALRALRPETALHASKATRKRRPWRTVAASVATAAILIGGLVMGAAPDDPRAPLDWHNAFVAKRYDVREGAGAVPVSKWIGQQPDLSSANLTLVDMAGDVEREFYLHYAGVNDCRLTFGAHAAAPDPIRPQEGLLTDEWNDAEFHYTLIAVGMDRGRFDSIASLLREHTRIDRPDDGTLVAVREATRDAVPCA